MKYLRYFENNNNLKKYVCVRYLNRTNQLFEYYIDEILEVFNDENFNRVMIDYKLIYKYEIEEDKFVFYEKKEQLKTQTNYKHYMDNYFLFSSDDLNECFEYLRLVVKSNKYNI